MSADRMVLKSGMRYTVKSSKGACVTADRSAASKILHLLPPGTIVVSAEVADDANGGQRVRISSPAGWLGADHLEPAEPAANLKLDAETFNERHRTIGAGDRYGLAFPFTLEMLREVGPEFLTTAFRAAGTISEENRVTEIVSLQPLGTMGASENALLTVAYAKSEPALQTELFIKFPPADAARKIFLASMSHGEVEMQRLAGTGILPVTTAKYYFGDYCSHTSNYMLITGRVPFGIAPIEPAYRKGYDHEIPDIEGHYRVLTKALARLVAAHKTGAIGYDLEPVFPFARAARTFELGLPPAANIDRLIDFIARIAPQLFVAEGTKPDFLRRWREDLLFGLEHKDTVIAYLHENIDYTGLCHPNLNVDNAWYWRDASGDLQVGLLDWGGAGQMSIAQALTGMLMMPEPEMHMRLVHDVVATFVAEYAENGGLALDPDELLFQYKASIFSTAIWMIVAVVVDLLFRFSEDDYKTMSDRFDSRLQDSGMCSAIIWIDNMLREWLDELTPGDACRRIVARKAGKLGSA